MVKMPNLNDKTRFTCQSQNILGAIVWRSTKRGTWLARILRPLPQAQDGANIADVEKLKVKIKALQTTIEALILLRAEVS